MECVSAIHRGALLDAFARGTGASNRLGWELVFQGQRWGRNVERGLARRFVCFALLFAALFSCLAGCHKCLQKEMDKNGVWPHLPGRTVARGEKRLRGGAKILALSC